MKKLITLALILMGTFCRGMDEKAKLFNLFKSAFENKEKKRSKIIICIK